MGTKSIVICAGIVLATLSGAAAANGRVGFGITIGVPAPVYAAPAPGYYPPPAYYPYYPAPRAAYYAPPAVYYAPAPRIGYGVRGGYGLRGGYGGHHRR